MVKLCYFNVNSYILEKVINYCNEFNVKFQNDKLFKIILPIIILTIFFKEDIFTC